MTALALKPALTGTRLALALLAMYGAIAVYLYERSAKSYAGAIEGFAEIIDGDTLRIGGKTVRLLDIDAPELDQTCGEDRSKIWLCGESAADALKTHLTGQKVRCELRGYDVSHRLLGLCALPDGSSVNLWSIREGWSISSGIGNVYKTEESEARLAKRGIWSTVFISPRQWREQGFHDNRLTYGD